MEYSHIVTGIVLCYSHQVCFLVYYLCKINNAFTFTGLLLNFYTSVSGCGPGFGIEQKYWRIDGFGKKRHGSADLHTPIHPLVNRILISA